VSLTDLPRSSLQRRDINVSDENFVHIFRVYSKMEATYTTGMIVSSNEISPQKYWASGLCPSPSTLTTIEHDVLETGPVIDVSSF
jgi:hypothetical protein